MTSLVILESFEREIGELDNELTKPSTDDSLFWINQGIVKFVKTRFNGDFVHKTGYEQTEKRRNDLDKLFRTVTYDLNKEDKLSKPSYDYYEIEYPNDFLYALNEDVVICDLKGEYEMDTCVFECT